jgi:hypothetical protein
MPMLPTDSRSEWDGSILDDPRSVNLWDGDRLLGQWLGERDEFNAGRFGPIVWDAFFVFGPDSSWQAAPSPLLASGTPVIGETSELTTALSRALSQAG